MEQSSDPSSQSTKLTPFEREQRRRTLGIILWISMITACLLAGINLYLKAIPEAIVLFALALVCLPAIWVNHRGHYLPAAILVTIMVFVAADYNLYQGNGIHDPGIVSLPILVTFGSLLFGKRAAPFFALAGIASVIAIGSLEISGAIHTSYKTDWDDILTISILIAAAGLIVWVVMENLEKSMRQARQSEVNMRQAYYSTLEGWAKALEYRDRETEGHSRKVTAMTVRLAKELGFSEEEMTHTYRGALLHDIGKMALPDQVLFKPGPLDAEEWKQVKQHPIFARDLLDKIPFLQPSLSIPYSHHERWDGKGYPQGLKGEEIPLAARIFTLVDHYEALNSDRPYRKAWLKEKILVYINENAGTIFDPVVVKTFFRLYERGEIG
jgi:HD-GYP domain-containing protein (c-di-GMP phosphodiesterase class II)